MQVANHDAAAHAALFERAAVQAAVAVPPAPQANAGRAAPPQEAASDREASVFQRLGALTRTLHDALRELGYDKAVERAVSSLPDARERLAYIANLTGQAAERTLAAAERGRGHQDRLTDAAAHLAAQWDRAFNTRLAADEFLAMAVDTRSFLKGLPGDTAKTNSELTEIMLAQDFHDLTGQVIQRIVRLAQTVEEQLVQLLIEVTPPEKRTASDETGWLNGPVINAAGRDDVVTSQAQVDDLLDSLGF